MVFSLIWIKAPSADIQKIESLVRQCIPIPQKMYKITKRLKTPEHVEQYFPAGFLLS